MTYRAAVLFIKKPVTSVNIQPTTGWKQNFNWLPEKRRIAPFTGFNFKYATIFNDAPQGERTSVSRAIARDAAGTRRAQKCSEYTTNVVALPENPFAVASPVRQKQGLCTAQSLMWNSFGV